MDQVKRRLIGIGQSAKDGVLLVSDGLMVELVKDSNKSEFEALENDRLRYLTSLYQCQEKLQEVEARMDSLEEECRCLNVKKKYLDEMVQNAEHRMLRATHWGWEMIRELDIKDGSGKLLRIESASDQKKANPKLG